MTTLTLKTEASTLKPKKNSKNTKCNTLKVNKLKNNFKKNNETQPLFAITKPKAKFGSFMTDCGLTGAFV